MSFDIDPHTGALSNPSTTTISSWPNFVVALKADPSGRFLYASNFNTGNVHSFSVNATNGTLDEVRGSPFFRAAESGNGGAIGVSPNGKYVYYADAWGNIGMFVVNNGVLTPTATLIHNDIYPSDFAFDPTGRFLYVAHNSPGPEFAAFSVDQGTGALSSVAGSPFTFQTNTLPFAIAVHPDGRFVYASLSNGYTTPNGVVQPAIAGLKIDGNTGALTQLAGFPFVYGTGLMEAGPMVMDPKGRFLYASTLGGLMGFRIDSATGALSIVSGAPYQGLDSQASLAIDPAGNFLYVSEHGSIASLKGIAAFSIDPKTGALTLVPGSPFPAGNYPGPVTAISLP